MKYRKEFGIIKNGEREKKEKGIERGERRPMKRAKTKTNLLKRKTLFDLFAILQTAAPHKHTQNTKYSDILLHRNYRYCGLFSVLFTFFSFPCQILCFHLLSTLYSVFYNKRTSKNIKRRMPVLILLDHSIGMAQNRQREDGQRENIFDFAKRQVARIFDHLKAKNPLEVVQLFLFSSDIEPFSDLTRDTDSILMALANYKNFSSNAHLSTAFEYIKNLVNGGSIGNSKHLLYDVFVISRESVIAIPRNFQEILQQLPLPQYCQIHFLCCDFLSPVSQGEASYNFRLLQKKIALSKNDLLSNPKLTNTSHPRTCTVSPNNSASHIPVIPTSSIADSSAAGIMITGMNEAEIDIELSNALDEYFTPLPMQLICGTLSGRLSLFPTLPNTKAYKTRITIQGFIPANDVQNCKILSRHLIDPIADNLVEVLQKNGSAWPKSVLDDDSLEKEFENISSRPHFTVLLKKSLIKTKNAAVCIVDNISSDDGNTTLTGYIIPHSEDCLPLQLYLFDELPDWFDDFCSSTLKNISEILPPKKIDPSRAIILHETILQTDIAKVFRYARRLPERREAVLAEIDKFIKLVRSCYFPGLGLKLVAILERELSQPETKADFLIPIIAELKLELGL